MPREGDLQDPDSMLQEWSEGGRFNVLEIAGMLEVPIATYERDPLSLVPALQQYVSKLPLQQFEQSDWATLHSDLVSVIADILVRRHNAAWRIAKDPDGPLGFRYVIEARGTDGQLYRVDPADVVLIEFREPFIEITRMLATAEGALKLSRSAEDENL